MKKVGVQGDGSTSHVAYYKKKSKKSNVIKFNGREDKTLLRKGTPPLKQRVEA